jgi:branched-chain amino acid transport system permease protein
MLIIMADLLGVSVGHLFSAALAPGLTLAALYFMVASGFTLVFGLMRQVNLAHGSLYLLGGYVGYEVSQAAGSWFLGVGAGFISMALVGVLLQVLLFRHMEGQDLRQTLVTIGLSIIAADLMLAKWGGLTYQFDPPERLFGAMPMPLSRTANCHSLPFRSTPI